MAIARAVAKRPDVLLCDEPTGALDYATGKLVLEVLERVNRELGTTTAVITHNAAIAGMADRVIRISSGRIVEVRRNANGGSRPAELVLVSALDRKLLRDLWHLRGQVLAAALVVACGVATFVSMREHLRRRSCDARDLLRATASPTCSRTLKRAPRALAARSRRSPAWRPCETRVVRDVTLDVPGLAEPATGRLVSIPERPRRCSTTCTCARALHRAAARRRGARERGLREGQRARPGDRSGP